MVVHILYVLAGIFCLSQELFGPLSMRGLENDLYVRQIDGYLPTAEVAFIDEIFKANSAILNALLTLLNERLFDNGNQRFPVPLLCLVGPMQKLHPATEHRHSMSLAVTLTRLR